MEKGKRICNVLKAIRQRIADANAIPIDNDECQHEGDCPGTCPKCDAEVEYITKVLEQRTKEKKPVDLKGLVDDCDVRSMLSNYADTDGDACENDETTTPDNELRVGEMSRQPDPELILTGDVMPPDDSDEEASLTRDIEMGVIPEEDSSHIGMRNADKAEHYTIRYQFACSVINELIHEESGNIVFSPAGLCNILEMLSEGMDWNSDVYNRLDNLIKDFNSNLTQTANKDCRLEHASALFADRNYSVSDEYKETLNDFYDAQVYQTDFSNQEEAKRLTDNWVARKTHNMIRSLDTVFPKESIFVLLDTIYMDAKWQNPFDEDYTEECTFHNSDNTTSEVNMMYQELDDAEYKETHDYQAIRLPYKGNSLCMTVVLPKEDVTVESIMEHIDWLNTDYHRENVDLYLPRLNCTNDLSFKDILCKLQLAEIFDTTDCFPEITTEPAFISDIKQKCVFKVEEKGTEAAAVTMAICEAGCPPPDDLPTYLTMLVDRPFGFAIQGTEGEIVFMGVVRQLNE